MVSIINETIIRKTIKVKSLTQIKIITQNIRKKHRPSQYIKLSQIHTYRR